MAKLIYSGIMSWTATSRTRTGRSTRCPDPEVHEFVNDLERPIGTYLYGRRMYEVMAYWETGPGASDPQHLREYGEIWRSAEKIVYSSTLQEVASDRTRIERAFDPAAVRELKAAAASDLGIGGAELASQAIRAGLVDEYDLFLNPVVVGGGTPFLPDHVRLTLDLLDEHVFGNGVVHPLRQPRRSNCSLASWNLRGLPQRGQQVDLDGLLPPPQLHGPGGRQGVGEQRLGVGPIATPPIAPRSRCATRC